MIRALLEYLWSWWFGPRDTDIGEGPDKYEDVK